MNLANQPKNVGLHIHIGKGRRTELEKGRFILGLVMSETKSTVLILYSPLNCPICQKAVIVYRAT